MGGSSTGSDDLEGNPTQRVCSDPGKENMLKTWEASKPFETPLRGISAATELGLPTLSKALASNALGTSKRKESQG